MGVNPVMTFIYFQHISEIPIIGNEYVVFSVVILTHCTVEYLRIVYVALGWQTVRLVWVHFMSGMNACMIEYGGYIR